MTTGEAHGKLWSRGARAWMQHMEPNFVETYTTVHDLLGMGRETRLLDVGCGPGGSAMLATGRGATVSGLDASPGSIEIALQRMPGRDFRVGDMETLPWQDDTFDAVTGFNSFQFAGDPVRAFSEARRVLAPGGTLGILIWAPPERSQQPKVMGAAAHLAPPQPAGAPGPFALSAPGRLESVLEAAGWRQHDGGEVTVIISYDDLDAAVDATMAGSSAARAAQHVGEERTREAIAAALQEFRTPGGGCRMENVFRYVIAEAAKAG